MNALLPLGRWLFAIPLALFGVLHLMYGSGLAGAVPAYLPAPTLFVYFTGLCLIGASLAFAAHKYDKLAAVLLAVFMLCMVVLVDLPGCIEKTTQLMAMPMMFKDIMLAGASLMYARHYATDRSVIG